MSHLTTAQRSFQQSNPNNCPAKALPPSQRWQIALQALVGRRTITGLAEEFEVSRKFVYRQAASAQAALEDAFTPGAKQDDKVLFQIPVTKAWLRQVILSLTLNCHSSYSGVFEFCRDILDVKASPGEVFNTLQAAVAKARVHNQSQELAPVTIAGFDEIFQNGQPVLVGADIASTYCFLLSPEEHRDANTWGVRLLEARERGLNPQATIADFGTGFRAGQKLALPETPCRGDIFHLLQEVTTVVTCLENQALKMMTTRQQLEHKRGKLQRESRSDQRGQAHSVGQKIRAATAKEAQAVALADDVALLARWLHNDILAVAGPCYADRCALFNFIVTELQARQSLCPKHLGRLVTFLQNNRDQLLAFAAALEQELAQLAATFEVAEAVVRELLELHGLDPCQPLRWQKEAALRCQLGGRFYHLEEALQAATRRVVRASSVVENLNSRLRSYFFLRRHLSEHYLELLQFFLNHRRFLRSERPERVGKSPRELLTGKTHLHWLEMLGYTRFSRN